MAARRPASADVTQDITTILVPGLSDMIDPEFLQKFQDMFAESFDLSMVIRNTDGTPITTPSRSRDPVASATPDADERARMRLTVKTAKSGHIEKSRDASGFLRFAVPVIVQGRVVGVMQVGSVPDTKTDLKHLADIAKRLETTREEVRRQSKRRVEYAIGVFQFAAKTLADICHEAWLVRRHLAELRTLQHVSQLLNSTQHVNEVLELVVETVCSTLKVKACGLRLLDPETGELFIKAVHGLSPEYLGKGGVSIKKSEVDRTAMEGEPVYIRDVSKDPRILYPAEMAAEGIQSNLVIGLKVRGRPIGALRIYTRESRYFHQSEIALAEAIANLAAVAIQNAKLYEQSLEKERLEYELTLAGQIQKQLLPSECPHPEHFDMCAINEPCRQVGGDFFDYIPDPYSHRLGIVIADVCGKSMAGALLMATARSALRVQSEHCTTAAEIVTRANMSLCRDTRAEEFVTLFFAKLDTRTKVLHYANAGHSLPRLYRGDEVIPLEGSGMVCGVLPENTYHETDLQFEPGDILLLYTDGLDEARNAKEELFGLEHVGDIIRANRDRPAGEIVDMLRTAVHKFRGPREQADDLTLILIKVS